MSLFVNLTLKNLGDSIHPSWDQNHNYLSTIFGVSKCFKSFLVEQSVWHITLDSSHVSILMFKSCYLHLLLHLSLHLFLVLCLGFKPEVKLSMSKLSDVYFVMSCDSVLISVLVLVIFLLLITCKINLAQSSLTCPRCHICL